MAEGTCQSIRRVVTRKRTCDTERPEGGSLRRCLRWWDLTALGVGSTLGIGVYVLIGAVALQLAGPSIVLSFLIAAFAALLAGLCYAEFGARVPLAGSSYTYAYVTVGELIAFIVGWSNILEFVFGSATIARGLSLYVDMLSNYSISEWQSQHTAMTVPLLSSYFDLLAMGFVIVFGILLVIGVRESTMVNNIFCLVNVIIILIIIIAGVFKVDSTNWNILAEQVPPGFGEGGFFPYGVWGTLQGAAVCFYAFVGFEILNSAGEEVKSPRRTIPIAILLMLTIVFLANAGVSIVVTMMLPYYEVTAEIASVSMVFSTIGWEWARWIIVVGAILGISTSLFGSLFPLPRLLYAMASDGLFIHWFAKVSTSKQSPVIATVVSVVVIAIISGILAMEQLLLVMSVGTLSSYTIVAICVVVLRYRSSYAPKRKASYLKQIFGCGDRRPTPRTEIVVDVALAVYIFLCVAIAIVCIHTYRPLAAVVVLHVLAIISVAIIALQPTGDEKLTFKTPLVPFLPCLSIYANVHLMVIISWHTWVRVLIWILIGIPIYLICICCYKQKSKEKAEKSEPPINKNGKADVQIVVESPTPPGTLNQSRSIEDQEDEIQVEEPAAFSSVIVATKPAETNKTENVIQEIQIENNEEKEAKIIDLLDKVLQAEEDSYGEIISLKENKEEDIKQTEPVEGDIPHRKSLSELSDAGSDVSGNQVLSKYDVIAQVHREDLPKVSEEEERGDNYEDIHNEDEYITAFNESETNSRTDESGYSDTLDRRTLGGSMEDTNVAHIPAPPPFDENYFKAKPTDNYRKFNTISSRPSKADLTCVDDDISEPRASLQSNNSNSQAENNIRFGSARQIKFMSKLNDIFQKTISHEDERREEEPRGRSQSTGNVVNPEFAIAMSKERPQLFLDLKKELLSREPSNMQTDNPESTETPVPNVEKLTDPESVGESDDEENSMSRDHLKNKLESIFAVGGPQLLAKPRLMKSNPPTPEETLPADVSSTESIPKLPKMEKNDTLKRQKEKFGQVLNSFRLSMNKDDQV